MDKDNQDYIDETDLEAYQFLFELPDADKLILAKFAELSTIEDWENMVRMQLKKPLPAWSLLDKIHLDYASEGFIFDSPIGFVSIDKIEQIGKENETKHNGIVNLLEVNTLALLEGLRQNPDYTT